MQESSNHFNRYKNGLVVGKFMPFHRGHEYLIQEAARFCEHLYILVYSNPDPAKLNSEMRSELIKKSLGPQRINGAILHFRWADANNVPFDYADDYTQRETLKRYIERRGSSIPYPDAVFTSESYGPGFARHLGVEHHMIDMDRSHIPVSGTMIRENVYENMEWMPEPFQRFYRTDYIERVAFLGAESTGKSTISRVMAEEYDTHNTTEYGRDMCEGDKYHKIDTHGMETIVKEQEAMEDGLIESGTCKHFLFCDTNAITTLFYAYEYNNEASSLIWDVASRCKERYDHVFLCDIDIPFEDDGTRRLSGQAHKLQDSMVRMQLDWFDIPYVILRGTIEERIETIRNYLDYHKQRDYYLPSYEFMRKMEKNIV